MLRHDSNLEFLSAYDCFKFCKLSGKSTCELQMPGLPVIEEKFEQLSKGFVRSLNLNSQFQSVVWALEVFEVKTSNSTDL